MGSILSQTTTPCLQTTTARSKQQQQKKSTHMVLVPFALVSQVSWSLRPWGTSMFLVTWFFSREMVLSFQNGSSTSPAPHHQGTLEKLCWSITLSTTSSFQSQMWILVLQGNVCRASGCYASLELIFHWIFHWMWHMAALSTRDWVL